MAGKFQQTTDEISEACKQRIEEKSSQREKCTNAWCMEVAATQTLDKFSTSLKTIHEQQNAEIEEFFQVAQMNLQQGLDKFQYHAQETLHAGIFGADHPNPRAQHAEPPLRVIAVEAEEEVPSNEDIPLNPELSPPHLPGRAPVTPQQHPRWKNVDMASLQSSRNRNKPNDQPIHSHSAATEHKHHSAATERKHPPRSDDWTSVTADKARRRGTQDVDSQDSPHNLSSSTNRDAGTSHDQKIEMAENYIARLRKTPTPMQLQGQQCQAVVTWYNFFVDFLKTYRVPIKIFDEFQVHKLDDPLELLYPRALGDDPHMYDRYSAAIYARLEEDQILDPENQVYMGLLRLHNSTQDGYIVLKSILAATLLAEIHNISVLRLLLQHRSALIRFCTPQVSKSSSLIRPNWNSTTIVKNRQRCTCRQCNSNQSILQLPLRCYMTLNI